MEMVFVGGVGVGAEHGAEIFAGGCVQLVQKAGFVLIGAVPVSEQADFHAAFQFKPGDIQRIGKGVLTDFCFGVAIAVATDIR